MAASDKDEQALEPQESDAQVDETNADDDHDEDPAHTGEGDKVVAAPEVGEPAESAPVMSATEAETEQYGEGIEPDDLPAGKLSLVALVLLSMVLVASVGIWVYAKNAITDLQDVRGAVPTDRINELREAQHAVLAGEAEVFVAGAPVQPIAIDTAIDRLVAEPERLRGTAPAAPAPTPTPTPEPTLEPVPSAPEGAAPPVPAPTGNTTGAFIQFDPTNPVPGELAPTELTAPAADDHAADDHAGDDHAGHGH
jgi:hypothetical protein